MYYPSGPNGPEYGVLRLVPRTVKGWHAGAAFDLRISEGKA
jgi:hypothetical protein